MEKKGKKEEEKERKRKKASLNGISRFMFEDKILSIMKVILLLKELERLLKPHCYKRFLSTTQKVYC